MASDLCKIDKEVDKDVGGPKGGSPERDTFKPKENIVSGRSLRSKHLKIVSDNLYFPKLETTGDIGQGIQTQRESVADTEFGMDSSGIITTLGGDLTPVKKGADLIRASYLNYFDVGLRPIKRKFGKGELQLRTTRGINQPDPRQNFAYFDVKAEDEARAYNLFSSSVGFSNFSFTG